MSLPAWARPFPRWFSLCEQWQGWPRVEGDRGTHHLFGKPYYYVEVDGRLSLRPGVSPHDDFEQWARTG